MEPIIYKLPRLDKIFKIEESDIYFDKNPSPKLMKFGFNNLTEKINLVELTSNPHYKSGLNFNFDRTDEDSIAIKGKKIFGIKKFDQTFSEFWEMMNIFGMLNTDQHILTSHQSVIHEIISSYQKMSGTKKRLIISDKVTKKSLFTLVLHKYSDVDLDENAAVQFIINDLPHLLSSQNKAASMILQIFSTQTQIMSELIYYLNTLYTESYIMRPMVVSELSDVKYLILLGLKEVTDFTIPKHPKENSYLACISAEPVPDEIVTVIQCINSFLIPKKFIIYSKIQAYLESKVYEGATYQEMVQEQNKNTDKWLETFINLPQMESLLNTLTTKTNTECNHQVEWNNLFN